MTGFKTTGVRATTLTPFHYHSLAVPSGTATLPDFIGDRAIAFAVANTLGCLSRSPALPEKDYRGHMAKLPLVSSLLETDEPTLLRPIGKRLNIDAEMPANKAILDATSTGNLKTWYFIQEVAPETVYHGAFFGADPFELASEAEGRSVDRITVRIGRHLSGVVLLERAEVEKVRLNAHTLMTFGVDPAAHQVPVERYAMHDLQPTIGLDIRTAERLMRVFDENRKAA